MPSPHGVLRDFADFLKALWREWVVLLTGGAIMAVIAIWALATGRSLPYNIGWLVLGLTFVGASFLSWRREREAARIAHQHHQAEVGQMQTQIGTLSRNPAEERRFQIARMALAKLGPDGVTVLRHLMIHQTLTFGRYDPPPAPGMNSRDTLAVLQAALGEHLVTVEYHHLPGGTDTIFSIAPGMSAALEQLLYEP